jgi:hypothetical protein
MAYKPTEKLGIVDLMMIGRLMEVNGVERQSGGEFTELQYMVHDG